MLSTTKKISVVVPTYNRKSLVKEAIESVFASKNEDLEVIVVDDGSTDGTEQEMRSSFGEAVRYIYEVHKGRSAARNRGVLAATGVHLIFLDSDDLVEAGGLELMSGFLDEHQETDVVCGNGYYCDSSGKVVASVREGHPVLDSSRMLETLVLHNIISAPHLAMVRRKSLESIGYPYFDENLHGMEDADFWIRLAGQNCSFRFIEGFVGKYRLHGSGNESSPESPNRRRRDESVIRFKQKVLTSSFFCELSVSTRKEFIRQLLLVFLKGRYQEQRDILRSKEFLSLPENERARLLYMLAAESVIESDFEAGSRYLDDAVELNGPPWKYRVVRSLVQMCPSVANKMFCWRRNWVSWRRGVDTSIAPHWR